MSESQRLGRAVDLCCDLQRAVNALGAVQSAMTDGPNSPESFTDGLCCVHGYLLDKVKALSRLLEDGVE